MSFSWVKGQVQCEARYEETFKRLEPLFRAVLSGVRDLDPILMSHPNPEALLQSLGLSGPITYLSPQQMQAIGQKAALEKLLSSTLPDSQRRQAQQILEQVCRLEGIFKASVNVADLGLIRRISVVCGRLEVTYAPTMDKCLHRADIKAKIFEAVRDLFIATKNDLGLTDAVVHEILGVWKAEDMAPELRAMHGAKVERNRTTPLTLRGAAVGAAAAQ